MSDVVCSEDDVTECELSSEGHTVAWMKQAARIRRVLEGSLQLRLTTSVKHSQAFLIALSHADLFAVLRSPRTSRSLVARHWGLHGVSAVALVVELSVCHKHLKV